MALGIYKRGGGHGELLGEHANELMTAETLTLTMISQTLVRHVQSNPTETSMLVQTAANCTVKRLERLKTLY